MSRPRIVPHAMMHVILPPLGGVPTGSGGIFSAPSQKTIVCCVNGGFCVGSQLDCILHRIIYCFQG